MKVIMVACGSGVASSETAAYKLRNLLQDRKLQAEVRVVNFRSLKNLASQADILVHIAPNDPTDYGVPTVNGVPFLTGMGLDPVMDEIEALLKS
ncbi:MAG: PTS sugar transporter subunit IIB [Anaerolineae bacterium]|nr:PTS sugar transporter subunit IIB [Anaerolineae bacterium]